MARSRPLALSEQKKFMSSEELSSVEGLVAQLSEVIQTEIPSFRKDQLVQPRSLANLILQLQLFMDQALGEKAPSNSRFMVKIPAAYFRDFAHPNGALKHILIWALEFRQQQAAEASSRRFELLSATLPEWLLQIASVLIDKSKPFATALCQHLSKNLKEQGLWETPRIYFWTPDKFDNLAQLQQIVVDHGGHIVDSISLASHIVLPEYVIDINDVEHYYRTLEQRGNKVFAHWWYFPDSYDTWMQTSSQTNQDNVETIVAPIDGKWKVGIEWLLLLKQFNEWMNEGDFEVHELPDELSGVSDIKQKDRSGAKISKLRRSVRSTEPELKGGTSIAPRTRLSSGQGSDSPMLKAESDVSKKKRGRSSIALAEESKTSSHQTEVFEDKQLGERDRKKSRRANVNATIDGAFIPPGTYVLHFSAPGSARGSYETLRSCSVIACANGLQGYMHNEISDEIISEIDSDSEETARIFLAAIRHEKRPRISETEYKVPSITSSAVSRANRKKKLLNVPRSPDRSPDREFERQQQQQPIHVDDTASSLFGGPTPQREAESIAPGVLRHPPRSIKHSIIGASKDALNVIRNLHPLDAEAVATCAEEAEIKLARQLTKAEAAAKVLMALWSTSVSLEAAAYIVGDYDDNEPPDVPPVSRAEGGNSELPDWLVSSNQHLSDFERHALEYSHSAAVSQGIDLMTDKVDGVVSNNLGHTSIILPSHTNWFSLDKVHLIEKEQLKSLFFGRSSTRECQLPREQDWSSGTKNRIEVEYKSVRNAIIERYRLNPRRYLTLTDCRQFIDGDAAVLLRMHSFLDFWGLINFQALPHLRPTRSRRPREFRLVKPHRSWLSEQLNDSKNEENKDHHRSTKSVHCVVCDRLCLYSYFVLRPGFSTGVAPLLINNAAWCPKCYANGKYPETLSQRQFVKVTLPMGGYRKDGLPAWTDGEIEKLIEGIEINGENWTSVAQHVGNRTPQECIAEFIRIPIDEPTFANDRSTAEKQHPFLGAPNSLMSLVNFLGHFLGPEYASLAVKAASDFFLENLDMTFTDKSDESQQLTEALSKPIDEEAIKKASQRAIEIATTYAKIKASEEELKIKKLMRQLNDLKEQQIDDKLREFYIVEKNIMNTNEDLESRLNHYLEIRKDLWKKLTLATKENQKAIEEYHRERQLKQLQMHQYNQQLAPPRLQHVQMPIVQTSTQLQQEQQQQQQQQQQQLHTQTLQSQPMYHSLSQVVPTTQNTHPVISDPAKSLETEESYKSDLHP